MESLEIVEASRQNRDLAALSLTGACWSRFFVPRGGSGKTQSRAGTAEWLPFLASTIPLLLSLSLG